MIKRRIFDVQFSRASAATGLRQKSFVAGNRLASVFRTIAFLALALSFPGLARATTGCPGTLNSINTSTAPIASSSVVVNGLTQGRRSSAIYGFTKYGVLGAYLGSNPGAPGPSIFQVSFRTGGPVGGGTLIDCFPGPVAIGPGDTGNGSGRIAIAWNGVTCGSPEQLLTIGPPGGNEIFGQQIDVDNGASVSAGAIASAVTSGQRFAAYFSDSAATYAVDVTSPAGNATATPMPAMQTLASWAGPSAFAVLGGNGSSDTDHYLAAVFLTRTGGTIQVASIGSDGRLTVLPTSGALSMAGLSYTINEQIAAYPSGSGYIICVVLSGGIDVFYFDGNTITRRGTIPKTSSDVYTRVQVPLFSSAPMLLAEHGSTPSIDIYTGGFLAGPQSSGQPTLATSIAAMPNDLLLEGFAAYVAADDPTTLYTYRVSGQSGVGLNLVTDTFDISCLATASSPNPTARFTLTNTSASHRSDQANYVGDFLSFTDNSVAGSAGPITNWYVWSNYNSSTSNKSNADVSAASAPSFTNLVIPCANGISGGSCGYGTISGTSITEQFGELVSASALDSTAATQTLTIKVPQTHVVGLQNGQVNVLSGGAIDASTSDGTPNAWAWTFTDANSSPLSTTCLNGTCIPPSLALNFTVSASYAGGYQSPAVGGKIQIADITGSISVPPTVFSGAGTVPVTFALQKGPAVSITSMTYQFDSGAVKTFASIPGLTSTVSVPLPGTLSTGGHTINIVATYANGANGTSATFSDSFQLSAVQYQPKAWLSKTSSSNATDVCSTNVFGNGATSCSGSAGTFFLSDTYDFSSPAAPATWDFGDGSPVDTSHTTAQIVSHNYAVGSYTISLTVQSVTVKQTLTVGSGGGGGGTLAASISGNSGPAPGVMATYSANVSGGSPPYTYSWTSSDGGSGSASTFSHSFAAAGPYTVNLSVHDSASHQATAHESVNVGGCTSNCGGGYTIVIQGPVTVSGSGTWNASVAGVPSGDLSISWDINSVPAGFHTTKTGGASLTYIFPSNGNYTLQASGTATVGGNPILLTQSSTFNVAATINVCTPHCAPAATFTVTGAQFNQFGGSYSAKAGDVITFTATDTANNPTYAWDFGDGTTQTLQNHSVTHAYASGGSTYTVGLTVTTAYGTTPNPQGARIQISGQSFQALIVPGAGHFASSGGAFATELSLFNNSNAPVTVSLDFEKTNPGIAIDPTKLAYPSAGQITIPPHAGWTNEDVTAGLLGAGPSDFGTLFMKYTGTAPSANARIYFSSGSGAPTYGTYLPVYPIGANGASLSSASVATQNILGLKFDPDFTSNLTVVSATPTGGSYDVALFNESGQQVGATQHYTISGFQQIKLDSTAFGLTPTNPGEIFYAQVQPSPGGNAPSIAIGAVKDNRTQDSLLLTDDTPRQVTAPGGTATYYVTGVGRTNSGAKTDIYLLNTSTYPLTGVNVRFQYFDAGGEHVFQIPQLLVLGGGEAMPISDVITSLFPSISGQVIGNLVIQYQPAPDAAPLIIEGRNYVDPGTGSYGMQLPAYAATDGLVPGSADRIVLTGLHNDFSAGSTTDYDFISYFGFVALGSNPVTAHVDAYDAATGDLFWSGDYALNSASFGDFVYQPTTGAGTDMFSGHPQFNLVISATGADNNTPVAAFATIQDAHSKDLVFIPGKNPASQ